VVRGGKQGVYRHQQRRISSAVCYKEACSGPGQQQLEHAL